MSVRCGECGGMAKDEKSIVHSVSCKEGQVQLIKALESKGIGGIGYQRALELLGKLGVYASRLESAEAEVRRFRASWRCWHCGKTFFDANAAEGHFGHDPDGQPVCIESLRHAVEQLEEKYGRLKRVAIKAGIDLPSGA